MSTRAKCLPLAPRNACALFHSSVLPENLQSLVGGRASRVLGGTRLEAVLELAGDGAEVPHTAGTGGLSALSLLGPVVLPGLGGRVTARSAGVLLDVKRAATATTAQNVRLVVALSEAGGTLGHFGGETV